MSTDDILVGFPLLSLPAQISSPFPKLSTWLASVKQETKPLSEQVMAAGKHSEQGEKPNTKNKKEGKTNKAKAEVEKKRKLRILCIHGYRQNGKTFREKLGSFRWETLFLKLRLLLIYLGNWLVSKLTWNL